MANRHQDIETRMADQNKAEDIFYREFNYKYMDKIKRAGENQPFYIVYVF